MRRSATTLASEMSGNETAFLTSIIQQRTVGGKHLEIGTAAGGTLCLMIKAARLKDKKASFVVVDPMNYFENQQATVCQNLEQNGINPGSVDIRPMTSDAAYRRALKQKEVFDFILIDGAHKIKYVTQDLRWARLLKIGGILMLHDYNRQTKDVTWPVGRFLRTNKNYRIIGRADSLLAIEKAAQGRKEVTWIDHLFARAMAPLLQAQKSLKKYKGRLWRAMSSRS